jgi:predicted LPLAT superfamily acyltransferase
MKKFLILLIPVLFLVFLSCSQEKAVERMMANKEIATMMMTKMMENPEMKAEVMQKMMQDPAIMTQVMDSFLNDTTLVASMVDKMMANDWIKGMLTQKVDEAKKAKKK